MTNQLKIFLVDDDMYYINLFEQFLRNLGCENIVSFNNGVDCLNRMAEKPDVVFLDYNMEHYTGYEILKKIKRVDPESFVVMISGQDEIKPAVDTLKQGAFDYLQKGDNEPAKVQAVLNRILEVKDMLERSKPSLLKKIFHFI